MTDLQKQANRSSWALAAPALLLLVIGSIGPLLIVITYSFMTAGDYSGVERPFTTQAWEQVFLTRDIFDDTLSWADAHLKIFWRSVKLSVLTTLIAFLLGLPTAWFIATRPSNRRAIWLFLITIPFWTNLLIRTIAINEIIRSEGLLNKVLGWFNAGPINLLYTDTAVLIGMAYVYLPMMVLPMYAAIDRFDTRLLEAGYDLFASRWQALWHIVIPVIRPGIVAGSILVFVPSLGAYVTPRVLGGGKNMMIGNFIELQFGQGQNWPLGAALAVLLLIAVSVALAIYVKVLAGGAKDA